MIYKLFIFLIIAIPQFGLSLDPLIVPEAPALSVIERATLDMWANNPATVEKAFLGESPNILNALYEFDSTSIEAYKKKLIVQLFSHLANYAFCRGNPFNPNIMQWMLQCYGSYLQSSYNADDLCARIKGIFDHHHYTMSHLFIINLKPIQQTANYPKQKAVMIDKITVDYQPIHYFKFNTFSQEVMAEIAEPLAKALKTEMPIIIDLANNSGGLVTVLLELLSYFLPYRTLIGLQVDKNLANIMFNDASYMYKNQELLEEASNRLDLSNFFLRTPYQKDYNPYYRGKIAIIISNSSYSASENFAKIMQLYGATVIGTRSSGCTLFCERKLFSNSDRGIELSFPTKEIIYPDGTSTEGVGVTPNISIRYLSLLECFRQWLRPTN